MINATSNTIGTFVNFGIGTTGVKEISSNENNSNIDISYTIKVIRIIVFGSATLGFILFIIFFPYLSNFLIVANNYFMLTAFGLSLLFNQIAAGYFTILQGLQKFKFIAKITLLSALVNLIISYFIYMKYKINGISSVFLLNSLSSVIISFFYYHKLKIKNVNLKNKYLYYKTKKILSFGFILTITGLIPLCFSYLFKIIIAKDGLEILGLYTAGYAIVNTYSNVVFASMNSDYLPRLSNAIHNKEKFISIVNKQSEVAIIIFSPIILFFIVYSKLLINILYSSKFENIDSLLILISIGTLFKMLSYPVATIFIAKSKKKLFFINELVYNIYNFILGILFFKYFGLTGLGLSFILSYLIYFFQVYFMTKKYFSFAYNISTVQLCLSSFFIIFIPVIIFYFFGLNNNFLRILIGSIFVLICLFYSIIQLKIRLKTD